jgi:anti-sigma-K factor RskA
VSHYDEATLALLALGESGVTDDHDAHLSSCEVCRHEVDELTAIAATSRTIAPDDYPSAPSPEVWDRILGEVRAGDGATPGRDAATVNAPVVALEAARSRRRRSILSVAVAAAVGLVFGVGATLAATHGSTSTPPPVAQGQVTVAALHPLDTPDASGTAVLRVVSSQSRSVTVTVANLPTTPGTFYEVWLMDPTDAHLVSLGVLGADGRGAYVVPAGLDLTSYSAVDVSLQPMNGSPDHSRISAVRGSLKA